MIKQAARRLLDKKEITQNEYDRLIKVSGIMTKLKSLGTYIQDKPQILIPFLFSGAYGAKTGISALRQNMKLEKSYNDMYTKQPTLKAYPASKVRDYFDVVKTFSPKSASNPLVAGALVNKMLEFGGVDHKLIQDLTAIEKSTVGDDIFMEGVKSTAKSLGDIHGFTKNEHPHHNTNP